MDSATKRKIIEILGQTPLTPPDPLLNDKKMCKLGFSNGEIASLKQAHADRVNEYLYKKMCSSCSHAKECHDSCENCEKYQELFEKYTKEI